MLKALSGHGYTDFWMAETSRFDAFTPLAAASRADVTASFGTAVASELARAYWARG